MKQGRTINLQQLSKPAISATLDSMFATFDIDQSLQSLSLSLSLTLSPSLFKQAHPSIVYLISVLIVHGLLLLLHVSSTLIKLNLLLSLLMLLILLLLHIWLLMLMLLMLNPLLIGISFLFLCLLEIAVHFLLQRRRMLRPDIVGGTAASHALTVTFLLSKVIDEDADDWLVVVFDRSWLEAGQGWS